MKLKTILCAILALTLFSAVPCAAAQEFNRLETIPTQYSDIDYWEYPDLSPLRGKSVVFFGDSLCYARIERGESNEESVIRQSGYAGRIATKYNMELEALGVSGSTLAVKSGFGSIYTRLTEQQAQKSNAQRAKVNYVILEGGVNDVTAEVPLGSVGDTGTSTFAGAVLQVIRKARELYPNAMVGFLIMYQMPQAENPLRNDLTNAGGYMDIIRTICIQENVPYLDFFHDTDFNDTVFKVSQTSGSNACLTSDGVHMTVHGYDVLTPYIASWMSSPYRTEPQPEPEETLETESPAPTQDTTPNADTPPADSTDGNETNPHMGLIVGVAGGAVVAVVTAVTVSAVAIHKKKKKKQSQNTQ